MLRHTNTYSKADLTDKQLSQEQKHGQQYFLDIRPHKLFAVEMYVATKRFCRTQIKSTGFKPKKLQTITNESLDIAPAACLVMLSCWLPWCSLRLCSIYFMAETTTGWHCENVQIEVLPKYKSLPVWQMLPELDILYKCFINDH